MITLSIDWNPDAAALRKFGIGGAIVLPLIAAILYWRGVGPAWTLSVLGVGVACAVLAPLAPMLLKPLYLIVTGITAPIGALVNLLLLVLVFYGMLLPLGLIFRLFGRDALQRKLEPQRDSYWQEHRATRDAGRYFKQF